MKCKNNADFRYTWAGQDEKFCCLIHAQQIKTIAEVMGYYVQMIPLSAEDQIKLKCSNEVSDSEEVKE